MTLAPQKVENQNYIVLRSEMGEIYSSVIRRLTAPPQAPLEFTRSIGSIYCSISIEPTSSMLSNVIAAGTCLQERTDMLRGMNVDSGMCFTSLYETFFRIIEATIDEGETYWHLSEYLVDSQLTVSFKARVA